MWWRYLAIDVTAYATGCRYFIRIHAIVCINDVIVTAAIMAAMSWPFIMAPTLMITIDIASKVATTILVAIITGTFTMTMIIAIAIMILIPLLELNRLLYLCFPTCSSRSKFFTDSEVTESMYNAAGGRVQPFCTIPVLICHDGTKQLFETMCSNIPNLMIIAITSFL